MQLFHIVHLTLGLKKIVVKTVPFSFSDQLKQLKDQF